MKLRNLANRLLGCAVLILTVGYLCVASVGVPLVSGASLQVQTTEITPLDAPNFRLGKYNRNTVEGTITQSLGVEDYTEYLQTLSASQALNDVVVAVVDSGIDPEHAVFTDRILTDYACNFNTKNDLTVNDWGEDQHGHGTHVSGIIADSTLSNVKILPIRIFAGAKNELSDNAFEQAISYLVNLKTGKTMRYYDANARRYVTLNSTKTKLNIVAVNLSLGTDGILENTTNYATQRNYYQNYVNKLLNCNILPIVAAGNINTANGENNKTSYYSFPAACLGTVAVSAYDYYDVEYYQAKGDYPLASFSYYNKMISLSAPGTQIWSACPRGVLEQLVNWEADSTHGRLERKDSFDQTYYLFVTYKDFFRTTYTVNYYLRRDSDGEYYLRMDGTSMATPFVTLCYALLMSDSSRTGTDNDAEALGLMSWDASVDGKAPYYYLNPQHKALLLASAYYRDFGNQGIDPLYGYGSTNVGYFKNSPATTEEEKLDNKKTAEMIVPVDEPTDLTPVTKDEIDEGEWQSAVWILVGIGVVALLCCTFKTWYTGRKRHE